MTAGETGGTGTFCPTCGARSASGGRFCTTCGAPLDGVTPPPAPPADDATRVLPTSRVVERETRVTDDDVADVPVYRDPPPPTFNWPLAIGVILGVLILVLAVVLFAQAQDDGGGGTTTTSPLTTPTSATTLPSTSTTGATTTSAPTTTSTSTTTTSTTSSTTTTTQPPTTTTTLGITITT